MLKRLLSVALLLMFAASVSQAALRSPQVPVTGTALATFFAAQGQTINVNTQQQDLQSLNVPATASFEVRAFGPGVGTTAFGAYNSVPVSPPLYLIYPGSSAANWFEMAAFRTGPARMVVSIFDPLSTLQGTTTYIGADPTGFGFYDQVVGGGTFFTQDSRNAGAAPRILAFNGTGTRTGWTWFACETGAGPGGDFADFVALVNLSVTAPVPVSHTKWSTLKKRFQ